MRIVKAFPPNYSTLVRKFPIRGKSILFAWKDIIYNPSGVLVRPQTLAHERVHGYQQSGVSIFDWWDMYIDDPKFRLGVEIPAHRVEAQFCQEHGYKWDYVAKNLAGPLYGNLLEYDEALALLTGT